MAKGDWVIARAYEGEPLLRRLWEANEKGALICRDEEYQKCERTGSEPTVVGFVGEDVFWFDEELWERLRSAFEEGRKATMDSLWREANLYWEQ